MKAITKIILTALLLLTSQSGMAQIMEKYPGILFSSVTPDGRYLLSSYKGVIIYDRQTDKTYRYGIEYNAGLGNEMSDDGIVVATTEQDTQPCYWKDGQWYLLKHTIGNNVTFAMANGITNDASRIVGTMDCRPLTKKAWPMVSPVLWTWDESKKDYTFEMLPHPDKDITGCSPQQVSATYISKDGKTILGQVTDYRGLLEYQIIYRQAEDGTWSYETSGQDLMLVKDAVWPPYPSRPVKPQAADYLTDEEVEAFNKANRAYLDSLEIVDLTGINPRMPFYEEFIKERKDEYDAAMKQYNADNEKYVKDLYAFFDAYEANVTRNRFEFNTHRLSENGQYYICNYVYPDPDNQSSDKIVMFTSPIRYNLQNPGEYRVTPGQSLGVFSICNDGSMTAATPKDHGTVDSRTSYVISPEGEQEEFKDWIKRRSPEADEWLQQNMTYEQTDGEKQTLYGTVRLNADASKILSYIIEPGSSSYTSYYIDLNATSEGIDENVSNDNLKVIYRPDAGQIDLTSNPDRIEIYDAAGRRLYQAARPGNTLRVKNLLRPGVYVVRTSCQNRSTSTKIVVM